MDEFLASAVCLCCEAEPSRIETSEHSLMVQGSLKFKLGVEGQDELTGSFFSGPHRF